MLLIASLPLFPSKDPMETVPPVPPAPPEPCPRAVELIERLAFRKAREKDRWGHIQVPHQYTVRVLDDADLDAAYAELFDLIQEHGVLERWKRKPAKRYLYPGDGYKYWAMTTDKAESRIINRMIPEDDEHSRPA